MTESVEINMLPAHASTNSADMERITELVNHAFADAEDGIWKQGAVRTTVEEVTKLTSDEEMAVARSEGKIVGCIRVMQIDYETGEFGLLAVDGEFQGTGAGRALVRFAEKKCQNAQLPKMQLELLIPRERSHPGKTVLENWYYRVGYQRVYTESFDESFPELAQMLAIPCKFVVFQKALT